MSTITEARAALKRWRAEATQGVWHLGDRDPAPGWEHRISVDVDQDGAITDYIEPGDAQLIAGLTNPALLDAFDSMFEAVLGWTEVVEGEVIYPEHIDRIAEAIVAADKDMNP